MLAFLCVFVHLQFSATAPNPLHLPYLAVADWMLVVND
jgi:hypothetical protein